MNPGNARALGLRRSDLAGRIALPVRQVQTAWRTLNRARLGWTLSIGTIIGVLFIVSNSSRKIGDLLRGASSVEETLLECAIAISVSAIVAIIFLLGLSVAEAGDHGQPHGWSRYTVATLVCVGASTLLVHIISPHVPVAALIGWYPLQSLSQSRTSVDAFVFANILLLGGLAVVVYVRLTRVRRSEAAFARAEIARAITGRQVLSAQLATMQAQVEPKFLFDTLELVESLYDHDVDRADRVLDDLIDFLHAAMPQLRGKASTLARECALALAYLRIVHARMGARLEYTFEAPPELASARFPPMLLLPLIDNAIRHGLEPLPLGGRIAIHATALAERFRLVVVDSGLGDCIGLREGAGLIALRERLAGLYGVDATLVLSATEPHGLTATIEVPRYDGASDCR
jgi:hypothetical protein